MNVVFTILTVLIIIACILLVIVVLLQSGKGDSLATNFVAGNQAFGVRETANILEKLTWGLVAFILVISIVSSFTLGKQGGKVDIAKDIQDAAATEQPAFPTAAPSQEAPAAEAPATEAPAN